MHFCKEIQIPKNEKTKLLRNFSKRSSGLISADEKEELMSYFSQLAQFEDGDEQRKRRFELEYSAMKLLKAFLQRQKNFVKQGGLQEDHRNKVKLKVKRGSVDKKKDEIMDLVLIN